MTGSSQASPRSATAGIDRTVVVSPHLVAAPAPEDGSRCVLPNSQAARSLGVPHVDLDRLARKVLLESGLHVARELTVRRSLVEAVVLAEGRQTGRHDPEGLARVAESTLRELLRGGVDLERLTDSGEERIARLGWIGTEYRRQLRSQKLVDPAEVLWCAADLCEERALRERLYVSGYPRLPAAERRFLHAYAARGSVVHLPVADDPAFEENREARADFERGGWRVIEAARDPAEGPGPRLARRWLTGGAAAEGGGALAYAYPDIESEARGVLGAAKGLLLAGVEPDRIAIVARNEETYGPVLLSVADEYGVPLRALYAIPLRESRLGSWLSSLLNALRNDLPFEETARVLAHPLARALDDQEWEEARRTHPSGWDEWADLQAKLKLEWPASDEERAERARLGVHCQRLRTLLARLGVRDKALSWPREAMAYNTLDDELRLLERTDRRVSLDGFLAELEELLGSLTVPVRPGRGGVELHTPLSLFGAVVDHLFVVGAAEGVLPHPVRTDPLLDPFEREELRAQNHHVEGVELESRREDLSFWALLHAVGREATFSYPRLIGRSETIPSPYLDRLGLRPDEAPVAPLSSPQEARRALLPGDEDFDGTLDAARTAFRVELRRESGEPPDGHDGVIGIPYAPPRYGTSVSRIIGLASCPFKFFAETVLSLSEPEEAPTELEPSLRGRLYHKVLELVVAEGLRGEELRSSALEALPERFEQAEAELGLHLLPGWRYERASHLLALRRAIGSEEFIAATAVVVRLEGGFRGEWRGITVRGRVDRIDETEDGLVFVDYKSGARNYNLAKDESGRSRVDLQLPIYREAAAPELARGRKVCGSRYYSVKEAADLPASEPSPEELDFVASAIRSSWEEGSYPVEPDLAESACRYCDYEPLCRKGPRLERKRYGR